MRPLTYIHESVLYAWNDSARLRRWVKRFTCPCLGYCYCTRSAGLRDCTGRNRRRKQEERVRVKSEIKQARRERAVANRKRSVSVDGKHTKMPFTRRKKTVEQLQSNLFGRLPAELRVMIYELVLCERNMSVVDSEAKADTNGRKEVFEFKAELGRSVSILRACKRIYREAIDVLYSGNTFSFKTYRGFVMFTRSIPPPRLANLTHITIAQSTMTVDGPTDYETEEERYRRNCTYDDFFTIITSLPRLKVLVMSYEVLSAGGDPYWLQTELALLDEMGRRNDMGGVEVWYEIFGSMEGLERFREREYDRRTWCLEGWTRWEVGERCSLR